MAIQLMMDIKRPALHTENEMCHVLSRPAFDLIAVACSCRTTRVAVCNKKMVWLAVLPTTSSGSGMSHGA
jgi:hypothetical protein